MPHFILNKNIQVDETSPFNFSSRQSLESLEKFLSNSLERISNESSPRIIVFETWLLVDYVIRQLIVWGIGANDYSNEEFDLRVKLLPISFKNCLDFLIDFRNHQASLPADPNANTLRFTMGFYMHLKKDLSPEGLESVMNSIDSYNKSVNPIYRTREEIKASIQKSFISATNTKERKIKPIAYRAVADNWLQLV